MKHLIVQIEATRNLLIFCRGHDLSEKDSGYVSHLERCLHFLERGNVKEAIAHSQQVHLGGMGCFNDWLPSVKSPDEDTVSVVKTFDRLATDWSLSMKRVGA